MMRFSRVFALSFVIPTLLAMCLAFTGAARSEAAASGLTLAEACAADGTASLYFGWQGANPAAKELWLDVISLGDGLRPAAMVSAGPLSPDARSYDKWSGFAAGGTYYIRLNQLMWDGSWDPSRAVSFTTFGCGGPGAASTGVSAGPATVASSSGSSTAATAGKTTVSATGFASSNTNSVSSTGIGPAPGSLSATAYTLANGGSSTAAVDIPVIRPVPPPTNTNTYYMSPPASTGGATAGTSVPSASNGGGLTPSPGGALQ